MSTPAVGAFRAPLYVAWEITHLCNARCAHCYSASGPDADRRSELTTAEAVDVVDQLAAAGVLVLAFSGGEPLLRADWRELIRRARLGGLAVNIGSNGASIDAGTAQDLADEGVSGVTISIDSHLPAVHDRLRGVPGLHGEAVRAVETLKARGVRVVVGYTPTRINHQDARAIVELCVGLGADAVNLSEYVPAGRGTARLALSPAELATTLTTWMQLRDEHRGRIALQWHDCRVGLLVTEEERRSYLGCGAGRLVARILPDGTVTPCVFLPTPIGSLRERSFASMWESSALLDGFRARTGRITGNCGACEHLETCGGCRAVAYAHGGDPFGGDPHCWVRPSGGTRHLPVIGAEPAAELAGEVP